MILKLDELIQKKVIDISSSVVKDEELDERIIDLKNSFVIGKIYESVDDTILDVVFEGDMIIADSVTLEPIAYHFKTNIHENLKDLIENYYNCYDFLKNSLDLKQILWQNIVLEVPMSFTKEQNPSIKGEGWELGKDLKSSGEDPRMAKLKELFERCD